MFTSLGTQLTARAEENPDAPAITCAGTTLTYDELDRRANRLARAYADRGVRHGDLVTLGLANGIEFVTAAFAAWKLGATPQPVSALLPARERAAIVALAKPSLVVGVEEEIAGIASVPAGFEPDAALSDAPHPDRVAPAWKVMTSGGSTGRPKLIVAGLDSALDPATGEVTHLRVGGVVLVPGPLYHNTPFQMTMVALQMGNHVVMLERFDAAATLEAIRVHRVEVVSLVPTMMQRILRLIEETGAEPDFGSVRSVWHMASHCPSWLKRAWIDLVGPERLWEMYGSTEYVAATVISGAEWLEHPGSVGRPVVGEICVLDEEGRSVPPGEVGEIYMRPPAGATLFRYIGATARTVGDWTTFGDLGSMDEQGYLYISDRRTDMIVTGGANIFPAEVEGVLLEHPQVLSAVVVGIPHHDLGHTAHAVVQTTGLVAEDELRRYMAERLVRYKQPRSYRLVSESLRDDAGKVRRTAIRDEETARLAAAH
ncbi:putative bile acid-coenzyme A ligase [Nocardia nova SH22a]|uniref:Putative bile acid-coenzyme A ligase n=1 Tax=Nocardia nova SH22a TaxID=1415166 RepID=W5TKT8_9NOCA|nr:AMP-binding protein [Nocardia nova]AHH19847.1 putative bile acid-coenzyme A ligase [Nocardia nova SH22a]